MEILGRKWEWEVPRARRCLAVSSGSCWQCERREDCLRVALRGSCDCSAEHRAPGALDIPEKRRISFSGSREKEDGELSSARVELEGQGGADAGQEWGLREGLSEGLLPPAVPSSCGNAGTTFPPPGGLLLHPTMVTGHAVTAGGGTGIRADPRTPDSISTPES